MSLPRGFRDLKAYQLAYNLAMQVFVESKHFPAEEKYSLTDQIRRFSHFVAIRERFVHRHFVDIFQVATYRHSHRQTRHAHA